MNIFKRTLDRTYRVADEIAKSIGLDRFGVGRTILRDHRKWKTGELEITSTWAAAIQPSFENESFLLFIQTGEQKAGTAADWPSVSLLNATVETSSKQLISLHRLDSPVKTVWPDQAFTAIPWASNDWHLTLDGTSYTFILESMPFIGSLIFANPENPALKRISRFLQEAAAESREHGILIPSKSQDFA